MRCCGIGYRQIESYGNWPSKCVISAGSHKVEDSYCGIERYNKKKEKIWVYITTKCINCGGAQIVNSPCCKSKHKPDLQARKGKKVIGK